MHVEHVASFGGMAWLWCLVRLAGYSRCEEGPAIAFHIPFTTFAFCASHRKWMNRSISQLHRARTVRLYGLVLLYVCLSQNELIFRSSVNVSSGTILDSCACARTIALSNSWKYILLPCERLLSNLVFFCFCFFFCFAYAICVHHHAANIIDRLMRFLPYHSEFKALWYGA